MSDSVTDSVADGDSPCNDPSRRHDLAVIDGDAVLNVSVMTLRGAVLVFLSMSCRSPIWAAKEKRFWKTHEGRLDDADAWPPDTSAVGKGFA